MAHRNEHPRPTPLGLFQPVCRFLLLLYFAYYPFNKFLGIADHADKRIACHEKELSFLTDTQYRERLQKVQQALRRVRTGEYADRPDEPQPWATAPDVVSAIDGLLQLATSTSR